VHSQSSGSSVRSLSYLRHSSNIHRYGRATGSFCRSALKLLTQSNVHTAAPTGWIPTADRPRRFPAPWRADKIAGGYVVRDANGQALVYINSQDNEADALQAKVLTKDEARRIAVNVARLPELLGKRDGDG
jgi:hypothetical protein